MNIAEPYGDPNKAEILIIGHDPRLQDSDIEAKQVFFMDYLEREPPTHKSERHKYDLAKAVIDYIAYLTSNSYGLNTRDKFYITNLCNEFLPHPKKKNKTVLIPYEKADHGISEIERTIEVGLVKLVLPMSLQVFYHLVRRGFVPNQSDDMKNFLMKARPNDLYRVKRDPYQSQIKKAVQNISNVLK